ncbi:MAG: alpha/beta hydrolase [Spirochaetaceae bacterium]|nr:MAG: alpha/beta hydrolase [Spirochaetaceae bacterium]
MPDFQTTSILMLLRLRRYRWARGSIAEQRRRQERQVRLIPAATDIGFDPITIDGLRAAWISGAWPTTGAEHTTGVTLYLHGGAYALGSLVTHREFLGRFASVTRTRVLAIEYRLAPEHRFPAALDDAVAAYRWLVGAGHDPARIVIAGDSAGGGLALATIAALRDSGDPLPACVVCLSPWVDLTLSCESIDANAQNDPVLSRDLLAGYARLYAGGCDTRDPLMSPLFADPVGFPPMLIHVGDEEILRDEAVELSDSARSAGVDVELAVWPRMFHVFQMVPFLSQSGSSLSGVARFIARHLA